MAEPTLADVLAARDEMKSCRPDTAEPFCRFVDLALQYFDTNRTALERFEAWRSQRDTVRPAMPPEGTVAEMLHMLAYAEESAIQYVMSGDSEILNESRARACGVVAVVEEWFRDNVVALAHMDWERSVRAHCNAAGSTPVIERFGDVAPFLSSHRVEIGGNGIWFAAVFAGRDWKPEAGR
jgi:hypothetical protein